MAPVTELVQLPLQRGTTDAAISQTLAGASATLLAQPGCLRVRYSRVLEDAGKLRVFVDWQTTAAHRAFGADAAAFGPFKAALGAIVDPELAARQRRAPSHVRWDDAEYPPTVLDARTAEAQGGEKVGRSQVTEFLQVYFPADYAPAQRDAAQRVAREFLDKMAVFGKGLYTGEAAVGWTLDGEEVVFRGAGQAAEEEEGLKSRVLIMAIGWESVDAHMRARETEGFREAVVPLRNLEDLRGMEVCHVSNTTFVRGE
ncbi:hypothetical protein AAE478_002057 [Parahypoxylon ruwenzoriense]